MALACLLADHHGACAVAGRQTTDGTAGGPAGQLVAMRELLGCWVGTLICIILCHLNRDLPGV